MKYFVLSNSDDLKEIGYYPQTDYEKNYDPTTETSHLQVTYDKFPDFIPEYKLELHKNAVPTNLIPGVGGHHGILVDQKLRKLLEGYKLPKHHFYKIDVFHNGQRLNYFWLHFVLPDIWEYIDMERSTVSIAHNVNPLNKIVLPMLHKEYVIKLIKHYLTKFEYHLFPEKIFFKENFIPYDIITLNELYHGNLISMDLRKSMQQQKISGISTGLFKPIV